MSPRSHDPSNLRCTGSRISPLK
uniref:Uncharacterized protein n=1 Tax=Lepeophtheirus salmonis TaxID=72036 RepID=A0A0K2TWF4_LEPSM